MKLYDKDILYEDNHCIVVFKEGGVLTQPSPLQSESLETSLKVYIKERDEKQGNVFLHAVHRIDRQVSGIVVFAKSQKGLSRLSQSLKEGKWIKEYTALVTSKKAPKVGKVVDYLFHGDHKATVGKGGKRAELEILSCEKKGENMWQVQIQLGTGRYHQIRAQCAHHGYPVWGDVKYGSDRSYCPGIALCHTKCSFPHPTRKEEMTILYESQEFCVDM